MFTTFKRHNDNKHNNVNTSGFLPPYNDSGPAPPSFCLAPPLISQPPLTYFDIRAALPSIEHPFFILPILSMDLLPYDFC